MKYIKLIWWRLLLRLITIEIDVLKESHLDNPYPKEVYKKKLNFRLKLEKKYKNRINDL